jgi:thioredoxin-like negative regulator of GroEL
MAPLQQVNPTNGKELASKVKKGTWCVLWWANWCPHCVMFHPSWMEAVKTSKAKGISVLEVEYAFSHHMPANMRDVRGFPTVVVYKDGKVVSEYDGDRSIKSVKEFIEKHAPKVPKAPKKKGVVK